MTVNSTPDHLYREVRQAAYLGLLVNLGLGVAKLLGGFVGHSFALIADAVNSLGDVVSTLVVLYGLHVAQRPPDDEHPYGHSRAEGIAASYVALLLLVSAGGVGWEAIHRLPLVHEVPAAWTLWIAGINVLIKEALYRYKIQVGRRTGSAALIANAWDHRSDALCAAAVLLGLLAIRLGGPRFMWADEAASLLIAIMIVRSGTELLRKSGSELMDVQADPEFVARIREDAARIPGVQRVEKLRVRKSGLEYFADIHIQVDARMTVDAGHRVGHAVKDFLVHHHAALRDVLVHLEPFPHHDPSPREESGP